MERLTGSRSDKNDSYVALDAPSQAKHIPFEILHMIISETDPLLNVHTHLKAFPRRPREALGTQKAFSLVCRRWRDVALQYVFSRIHITSSDGVDSHAGFFRDTPWVAEHVIKLTLRAQVSVLALDTLLRTLPSLQYLDISNSFVEGSPDADLQVDSSRALRELRYPCPEIGPRLDAQCETIQHVLRLFSAINYLDIGFFAYPSTINVDSVNARIESACSYTRDSDREFRIHNLKASGHTTAGFLVPEYLRRTGALKDLTSLSFFLAKPSLKIVSRMLNAVHMTLETLELSWSEWHDGFQNGEYFAGVQECLSDCRMLKDIELRVILPRHEGQYVHLRDGKIHRPATDEQGGWLQLLRALSAVSSCHLRSAKLCLVGLLVDPHILDWGGLREWCSGVPCLETVEVVLHQAYDQTSCFAYEMQSFERIFRADYHPPRSATVADSLILVGRFIDEDEVKCRHDGCRRYHANEQSSKSQGISVVI